MSIGYWDGLKRSRLTRRRVIAGAGGVGLGAAALALIGCGGDKGSGRSSKDAAGLLFKPVDTTKQAQTGGSWIRIFPTTVFSTSVDPYAAVGLNSNIALFGHSRLFQYKPTVYPEAPTSEVAPDAAESFEISPDHLQVTFKLKPDIKLDSRPPTNGRSVVASDVVFSWNKYAAQAPNRKDLVNALNPFGPVLGVTAPDERTVVYKLAFPYVPIVPFIVYPRYGQIQPKEADGGYNPQLEMRGSGPWQFEKWEQDVVLRLRRNPDWYVKGRPFFDTYEYRFIPEYATALSQFRSGNIWEYPVRADDILPTKRDIPKLNMVQTPAYSRTANVIFFGSKPGSVWADARVRQAAPMLIDRDLWLETVFATKQFADGGLPVDMRWHTHAPAGETLYWEDPKTGAFGPSSKNFKHDPAGAKALLKAAGFNSPIEQQWTISPHIVPTGTHERFTQIFSQMMMENNDFKFNLVKPQNLQAFQDGYIFGQGNFDGVTSSTTATYPDIDGLILNNYGTAGGFQVMTFTDDKVLSLNKAQRSEFDTKKRTGLILDLAHHLGDQLFNIPFPGDVLGFNLAWPQLGNFMSLITHSNGEAVEVWPSYWHDKSKENA